MLRLLNKHSITARLWLARLFLRFILWGFKGRAVTHRTRTGDIPGTITRGVVKSNSVLLVWMPFGGDISQHRVIDIRDLHRKGTRWFF